MSAPLLTVALRGMLRPLLVGESARMVFDERPGIPPLYGDEGARRLDAGEHRELEDLGAVVVARSHLSDTDGAQRLADALRRAGAAGHAVAGWAGG